MAWKPSSDLHPVEGDAVGKGLLVCGVDEVGKGCLAGPVFVGAAVLDYEQFDLLPPEEKVLIRDSKTLTAKQRGKSREICLRICSQWAVAQGSPREIEEVGINGACFLAMKRALAVLESEPDLVIVDGNQPIPNLKSRQVSIVDGDAQIACIAAAAILAKTSRDHLMAKLSEVYPGYGLTTNVGYGTKTHTQALMRLGTCALHRRNFKPCTIAGQNA